MPRAVGLDAGEFEVKLVELDGSQRRPRLVNVSVEPLPEPRADGAPATRLAETARACFDEAGAARDGFAMSFACREAVLRRLTVPFVGREQIRKVIKFEAEGSIHSHNVDDMVVDFHTLEEREDETNVLVAAVPKPALRTTLTALERVNLEPESIDLDTMALFRAAQWCGAFDPEETEGDNDEAGSTALVADGGAPCRLVIDLGARSTRILVVQEDKLIDMRALRTGADSMAAEIGTLMDVGLSPAREAVEESLRTDMDFVIVGPDDSRSPPPDAEAPQEEDADEATASAVPSDASQLIPHSEVSAARDRFLTRLRRELTRFLTSVPSMGPVTAVWYTGGASAVPGTIELLHEVFETKPRELDVLAKVSHKLDSDEAREMRPKLAVAVGLAVDALGNREGFNFRQEELSFTKGFDRVKFPLAITCMLALFLVLVFAIRSHRQLGDLKMQYGETFAVKSKTVRGRERKEATFYGYLGGLVNPGDEWFAGDRFYTDGEFRKLIDKLLAADTFVRLPVLRQELKRHYEEQQKKSGYYADLRLGSGLGALVEFTEVLHANKGLLGRYLIEEMRLNLPYSEKARRFTFTIILRTDETSSFRDKWAALEGAFRDVATRPESCFASIRDNDSRERDVFEDGGRGGATYQMSLDLKPEREYPVFPKEAP
ncbi:MAG: pilus assembly protein PilM [Planctomycetota bacterium]